MGQKNTTVKVRKEIVKQEESLCYSTYGYESETDYITDANNYYGEEEVVPARKVDFFSNLKFSLLTSNFDRRRPKARLKRDGVLSGS